MQEIDTLNLDDVVARLRALTRPLPDPPQALIPVRTDGVTLPPFRGPGSTARPAAVLALIVPGATGDARVILTERADRGGHHSGEVSFPGGRAERDDADAAATALREAAEEVALDAHTAGVEVLAELDTFWIPVSDFSVTPVVAVARHRPLLTPSPHEVARIVEAPLAAFLPGAPIEVVERTIRGWPLRYGAYPIEGLLVWGATARVLGQLGAILGERREP
jgi:8-oxo-dGTP pyrophosphatase MutT (NUDIX family)